MGDPTSGPKVASLSPSPSDPKPGAFGLRWSAERTPNTRRWALVGRIPGRAHSLAAVIEIKYHPGGTPAEDIARVLAQLANDIDEGAAALMAAAMEQEGQADGHRD